MVADDPTHLTLEWHRDERGARIYVDVNRIAYAQHAVAPYGVRPRPGAPVAMPIAWEELSDRDLRPTAGRSRPRRIGSSPRATPGPGSAATPAGCRRSPQ